MVAFSAMFDGETHTLIPGEDFALGEQMLSIQGFEDADEDDLLPFETPTRVPNYVASEGSFASQESNHWATLALALAPLCRILGGERKQYQHDQYDQAGAKLLAVTYTFRYEAGESGWQGDRL